MKLSPSVSSSASALLLAQPRTFVPVTSDMLLNPSPNDWLMYNRTYDSQRYSPLKQIDKGNVDQLRMVWTRGQGAGAQEGIPLVHDGVMYLMAPGAAIQALDATNGNLIWEYQRKLPANQANQRALQDHRHVGGHDLHHHAGQFPGRARRQDRRAALGDQDRYARQYFGRRGGRRQDHLGRLLHRQPRQLLHLRARRQNRKAAVEVRHRRQHRRARRRQLGQYSGRQTLRRNLGRARDLRSHHQYGDLGRRESHAEHAHGAPRRSVWRSHFGPGRSV